MTSYRPKGEAHYTAWLIALLLLVQLLLAASEPAAPQDTVDQASKWNRTSALKKQVPAPLVQGVPDASVLPAWQELKQAALGDLKVFWHRRTGTPEAIYGLLADVSASLSDPEAAARGFLAQQAALLKMDSAAELQLIQLTESPGGYHVFFQQTYQGLPVHGGMVGVHIDRRGRIHALINTYAPGISLALLRPSVSSAIIYDRMLAELSAQAARVSLLAESRRELVVYVADDGNARLAWRMIIPAREPLGTWEAFWDAHTGRRLSPLRDRNYYIDGAGRVLVPNAVATTGSNELKDRNDSPAAVPDGAYSTVTLPGLDGSGFLNGPFVNTSLTFPRVQRTDNDFTDLDRGDRGFEEVEAYWAIDAAQRYIQGFEILNAGNYSIAVDVHGLTADNSFYADRQIIFGDGGVDDAEDAEIILHEYGHALLDDQVPGLDQNFDGMGEGFSDYWAATMSTTMDSADHLQYDPAVGEWDATFYNPGNPPFLRRVDTDAHYPEDRSSDPHVTGQIWSAALWDIHHVVGRETADRIFLEGNFLLPPNPSLPQAAQAMLQADRSINDGANNDAMSAVFEARGLLKSGAPSITVTSPNGGETWPVGSVQTITWESPGISGDVRIRLSRNGGAWFWSIFRSVPNTGSIRWRVTGPTSSQCLIQVERLPNRSIRGTSARVFRITRKRE